MTTSVKKPFSRDILQLDAEQAASAIAARLRHDITKVLRRRGAVLGISGGVDSSVSLALAVKALGPERVVGVLLPEHDSSSSSADLAHELAAKFGVETVTENISGALEGFGCYRRRDEAVARTFPEYDPAVHRVKIGLPQNVLDDDQLNAFSLTLVEADGSEQRK
ncbi:MAG: NAD(+) synthase, partial [Anaerolineae bacterium]|nr:NAD(+) synthase [Anaerolineae bacterium]